ncbi:putative lipid-transfer protein DIR1 [Capsella rubella]|uniref:putative lipid-transfer protein DIR1 n=1 Tax=Capsella rubella TaxID=81985 RepID=UPI000CD58834|nr:putative lipid-transfer protein DIR1 [Capsella rubella]
MAKNNTIIPMQLALLAIVLTCAIMVKEATSISICNIDTNNLEKCRPAVTGNNPPAPGPGCCGVVKSANLQCLCPYKPFLSRFGIDPSKVRPLLAKCGINERTRTLKLSLLPFDFVTNVGHQTCCFSSRSKCCAVNKMPAWHRASKSPSERFSGSATVGPSDTLFLQ